jgi:hypothetical protein
MGQTVSVGMALSVHATAVLSQGFGNKSVRAETVRVLNGMQSTACSSPAVITLTVGYFVGIFH